MQSSLFQNLSDWPVVPLKECCYRPEYGLTATATASSAFSGCPRYLRITDIQEGGVSWETVPFVKSPKSNDCYLQAGDVVIARIGATTGKAFLVRTCPTAVFASYLIRVRAKKRLLPSYLYLCFHSESYWSHIQRQKGGRQRKGVNISVLESFEIPLPCLSEQRRIVSFFRSIARMQDARMRETQLLGELFKSTLEELLSKPSPTALKR